MNTKPTPPPCPSNPRPHPLPGARGRLPTLIPPTQPDIKAAASACGEGRRGGAAGPATPPSCEHSPRPPIPPAPRPLQEPVVPARPAPRPAPPPAAAFMWIKAAKMTSLLTERYTETLLVIYWLSAPDGNH